VLETGDALTDLRAVFSWSYQKLTPRAARMFRLLGVHPGPDVSLAAAASLSALPSSATRAALAELTRASLLTEDATGRFGCHELLRTYAAERAAEGESADELTAARRRLADHYLRTAYAGSALAYPARSPVTLPPVLPDVTSEEFASYEAVLAWFGAEHRVLHAILSMAAESGLDEYCWTLAWYWAPILKRRGLAHEVVALQRTALTSAQRRDDRVGLAHVHYDLGHASAMLSDYETGHVHLTQALDLFTELGDRVNIGQVRHGLAVLFERQERYAEALEHAAEALRLRRSFADQSMVAYSENAVGWIYAHLGQYEEALGHCRRALDLHRESGSRSGAADTLDSIAFAYEGLADYAQAITHYRQALDIYRDIGDPQGESYALTHLGDAQLASGLSAEARASWEQALAALSRIPGVDTRPVRGRLAQFVTASAPLSA
jgi:tetratricopeptide (TPR) repeat protein